MEDRERVWAATQAAAPAFLGLSRADAEQRAADLGLQLRLLDWDELGDQAVALTSDLRVTRLTLHIRSGVVAQSEAG
jgi:hypothetical protein